MNEPGGEARRALIATALGVALGVVAALFSRSERKPAVATRGRRRAASSKRDGIAGRRAWRGKSAT